MVFDPASSGIGVVLELVFPLASPDAPLKVDQVIEATPDPSDAVPLTTTLPADEYENELPGEVMLRIGGVVSEPLPPAV
jgi:hypothetical protein